MITSKEETKQGMEALYHFQQQFPDADTETFLQTTSQFFQNHIKRQLADIHRKHQANRSGRPGTAGKENSASVYMDRLRQLTTRKNQSAAANPNSLGGDVLSPELPDVDRGGAKAAKAASPPRVPTTQLDSLKARLEKIKNNNAR